MRAVKAFAIIFALLALGCMVGGFIVVLQLLATAQGALGEMQALPAAIAGGTIPPLELGSHIEGVLTSSAAIMASAMAESQLLLFVLFGGAVVCLLITIVLLVALRPERRQARYDSHYDEYFG